MATWTSCTNNRRRPPSFYLLTGEGQRQRGGSEKDNSSKSLLYRSESSRRRQLQNTERKTLCLSSILPRFRLPCIYIYANTRGKYGWGVNDEDGLSTSKLYELISGVNINLRVNVTEQRDFTNHESCSLARNRECRVAVAELCLTTAAAAA